MERNRTPLRLLGTVLSGLLLAAGCAAPVIKMPGTRPAALRAHESLTFYGGSSKPQDTGIYVQKGEIITILPEDYSRRYLLSTHIGEEIFFFPRYHNTAALSGPLKLKYRQQASARPSGFAVDVLVWEPEAWNEITGFFERMQRDRPGDENIDFALDEAKRRREIHLAEKSASQEIELTRKKIDELRKEPGEKREPHVTVGKGGETGTPEGPPAVSEVKGDTIRELEAKLAELTETLGKLEEMKGRWEEERKKTDLLSKELKEKKEREKELLSRLKAGPKTPPLIALTAPLHASRVEEARVLVSGVAEDEEGIAGLEIAVNDVPVVRKRERGVQVSGGEGERRFHFHEQVSLRSGENRIKVVAVNANGLSSERVLTVHHVPVQRSIWAVLIGIDHYPKVRHLKYAVADARMIYDHLLIHANIPKENLILLTEGEATLTRVRSVLGTDLKAKARKEDMVIIFFAGHGATEADASSPDGDGLEKYLLPYDADPKDLYATALPMGEISRIFERIRAERLVFVIDSCYSGAGGGRTIEMAGTRANISGAFMDRISSGKGRVIITASGANEVSTESDTLRQGVFTFYFLEGLRGKADADGDGLVTVDEVYDYVFQRVPTATAQGQHPVKKGAVEGRLVLGVTQ